MEQCSTGARLRSVYKIGITSSNIKRRFWDIAKSYQLIQTWKYDIGQDAHDRERELLSQYSGQRIPVEIGKKLVRNGHTELFYSDILGLDLHDRESKNQNRPLNKANMGIEQLALW
jgi:T5orf172 domain